MGWCVSDIATTERDRQANLAWREGECDEGPPSMPLVKSASGYFIGLNGADGNGNRRAPKIEPAPSLADGFWFGEWWPRE